MSGFKRFTVQLAGLLFSVLPVRRFSSLQTINVTLYGVLFRVWTLEPPPNVLHNHPRLFFLKVRYCKCVLLNSSAAPFKAAEHDGALCVTKAAWHNKIQTI